jgi:hypothetical protein
VPLFTTCPDCLQRQLLKGTRGHIAPAASGQTGGVAQRITPVDETTLALGDPSLLALHDWVACLRRGSYPRRLVAAVHGRRSLPTAWELLRLPRRHVLLPASRASEELRQVLSRKIGPWHVPRPVLAVLDLPDVMDEYLRGRARQAVRTNTARARDAGVITREVVDPAARESVAHSILAARVAPVGPRERAPDWFVSLHSDHRWFAAEDPDAGYVALAVVLVAGSDACLRAFLATHEERLPGVRYLLHTFTLAELHAAGVRRIWADGPMHTAQGVQYFQRRLGYELARPRLRA